MVVDVIITIGAGVGAGGSSKASSARGSRGMGSGKGSSSGTRVEPQQQPWTSAGIARSGLTRLEAFFPPMNGSTDASCHSSDASFFLRAHS